MKLGAFLKQYLKQSLQAFKHPKQLLPTIILTVVWIILGILQIKLKENLPMKVLNFITYAQGGLYGGVASAIGGILGKVLVAGFVNALIVPLFMGKKPFNGMGNGFKELGKSLSLQGRKALAPLLKGFGAALILYGLSNTGGRFENSMAGIMAAVSLALAMGKKNGFLWNFACSYAQSVSKGKTPDYHSILRALTGMTLGFTLGVGMHAAGIGMVGLLGVAFLLLGWILGWGTKKEAIVAMALIVLTLVPAPPAQAAKSNEWVLVGKETDVSQTSVELFGGAGFRDFEGDITKFSFLSVASNREGNGSLAFIGSVSGLSNQSKFKEGKTISGKYRLSSAGDGPGTVTHIAITVSIRHEGAPRQLNFESINNQERPIKIGEWYLPDGRHNSPWSGDYSFSFPKWEDGMDDIKVIYTVNIDTARPTIENEAIVMSTTYYFKWNGIPMTEERNEGVVEEDEEVEESFEEESAGGVSTAEALANLVKEWLKEQGADVHSDETETILRDIVAGILAAGTAAAAAGAAGGGAGGGLFGGEGPDGSKSEEEKDWERQMEEYKKWEKSKFDKYTRKNPDGTITVTDPSTGKSSVWYPKEGGGYENENGTTYSDNDLANWLDDRERNSDYNRQNAETTEKNLEEWRKRNEELKDMDREIYEERKSAREEQYRRDERIRRLADKYHTDDDPFEVYEALAKEMEEAEAASEKARDKQAFWEGVVAVGDVVQATCDGLIAVIASGTGPAGKAIQATYIVGKNTLGRTSEALMARKQGLEGAAAGALKGFGVGVIDAAANLIPIKTDTLTGIAVTNFTKSFFTTLTIAINGHLDGKSKEEVKKEAIKAGIVQAVSTGMGAVLGKTIFGTETTPTPDKYKNTILTLGGKDLFSTDYSGTTADNLTALFESSVAQLNAGISGSKEIDRALDIN